MSEHHAEIIIIKRHGGHEEEHHGGAWKIAFADFMTAMMAFFLVLWIINATDKDTKTVIARYFNPVKLENPAKATKGVHGVDSSTKAPTDETTGKQSPGAPGDPKHPPASEGKDGGGPAADSTAPKHDDKSKHTEAAPPQAASEPAATKPTISESELFSDPYKSLDKIAAGRSALSPAADPDTGAADPTREAGATTVDAFRDPFKPIGPGAADERVTSEAAPSPPSATPDLEPQKAAAAKPPPSEKEPSPDKPPAAAEAAKPAAPADGVRQPRLAAAAAQLLKELQEKLGALAKSSAAPAIDVRATDEGLLISLTDKLDFSMFAIGSAEPRPAVVQAMDAIAKVLRDRPGIIVLRGHTDGRAYRSATYDNWRLSSARAQMAYYMLTRAGIPEARFDRVEGHADRSLRDSAHPLAAENRRIEILLRESKP